MTAQTYDGSDNNGGSDNEDEGDGGGSSSGGLPSYSIFDFTVKNNCAGVPAEIIVSDKSTKQTVQNAQLNVYNEQENKTFLTDSNGRTEFTADSPAKYRLRISKTGYRTRTEEIEFIDCQKCSSDPECDSGEYCLNLSCANISCECGEIQNHACMAFECCSENDCAEGMDCVNNKCILQTEKEEDKSEQETGSIDEKDCELFGADFGNYGLCGYWWLLIAITIILGTMSAMLIIKSRHYEESMADMLEKTRMLIRRNDMQSAREAYLQVVSKYKKSPRKSQEKFNSEIKDLYEQIKGMR